MGEPRTRAAGLRYAVRSGSSDGPEAAACWPGGYRVSDASRPVGPGEDRRLMRVGRQYAPGSAGQGLGPQGRETCPACLAASVGFGATPQGPESKTPRQGNVEAWVLAGGSLIQRIPSCDAFRSVHCDASVGKGEPQRRARR